MFVKMANNCSGLDVVYAVLCVLSFCSAKWFRICGCSLARDIFSNPCVKCTDSNRGLGLEHKSLNLLLRKRVM